MCQLLELNFKCLIGNIRGAEGPVFNKSAKFFVVAPENEVDSEPAGQILEVDLSSNKVGPSAGTIPMFVNNFLSL